MEGWIMGDIRTTALGGVPFGTSDTRPTSPSIGQTYYNGTLGVQEIYTSSGWLPATGANDFNVTLNGSVTTATFTKEYFAGAYTIASALLDNSYDIYVYDTNGNLTGYTKSPSLTATGNFNKIVVIGGTNGDLLSFSYKTTFTANTTVTQTTSAAFINSTTPTAMYSINDTTTISGGNFASNVEVYFIGTDGIERQAKSVVRNSSSELIATRPDIFPTDIGSYKIKVVNPGVTLPTGSNLHILNNAVSAGTTPNWTTSTTLPEVPKNILYSVTLLATDSESTDIDYSIISGSLPLGLSLDQETGVISGTYSGSDFNTTFTARAVDTGGNTIDRTFTIFSSNPVWNTTSLPDGFLSSYSQTLSASDNSSITYSIDSGSLPTGVTLNSSGLISGTPTSSGSFSLVFRATDVSGNYATKSLSFTIYGLSQIGSSTYSLVNPVYDISELNGATSAFPSGVFYLRYPIYNGGSTSTITVACRKDGGVISQSAFSMLGSSWSFSGSAQQLYNYSNDDHDSIFMLPSGIGILDSTNDSTMNDRAFDRFRGASDVGRVQLSSAAYAIGGRGSYVSLPKTGNLIVIDFTNSRMRLNGGTWQAFDSNMSTYIGNGNQDNSFMSLSDGVNNFLAYRWGSSTAVHVKFNLANGTYTTSTVSFSASQSQGTEEDFVGTTLYAIDGAFSYQRDGSWFQDNVGWKTRSSLSAPSSWGIGSANVTQEDMDLFGSIDSGDSYVWFADWGHDNSGVFGFGNDTILGVRKTNIKLIANDYVV